MMSPDDKRDRLEWLREHPEAADSLSAEDARRLLEDLSLHHTELEMQNEELKKAQEVIEESRERLSDLYDFAPVAYLTLDSKGVIEEANLTAAALLGVPRTELLGRTLLYFIDGTSRDGYFRHHRGVVEGRRKDAAELQLRRNKGGLFYGRLESVPVEAGGRVVSVRSALIDITGLKQAEAALRESEEKYRDLVESVNSIIIRVDSVGRVLFLNDYGQRFFGYSEEELRGKRVVETIVPLQSAARLDVKTLLSYMADHPERYRENEIEVRRRNGEKACVSWTLRPLHDDSGALVGALAVGNDITKRKRLEEQLLQARKMEAMGTLAGGIAHDFNNMLAVILGNAELALDDLREADGTRRNIEQIVTASKRARDLVKQILTFSSRSNRGESPLRLNPLVEEMCQLLRSTLPSTIRLELDIGTASDTVIADPSQIQQVLMNLATNAAHAMRKKGGVLTVRLSDVLVPQDGQIPDADLPPGAYVRLSVHDTGTGMTSGVRRRIFEPFFTTKETGEGTGMGLAVVHGVVTNHGGAITVESKPGKGSTFNVFLPSAGVQAAGMPETTGEAPRGSERILVVDDEPAIAEMTALTLRRLGYQVTTAESGGEAWHIFTGDARGFDLVITDQTMPDLTGIELAKRMLKVRKDLPIILFTGYSETVSRDEAKKAGISEFVMKPIEKREAAETIRRVLDAGEKNG